MIHNGLGAFKQSPFGFKVCDLTFNSRKLRRIHPIHEDQLRSFVTGGFPAFEIIRHVRYRQRIGFA